MKEKILTAIGAAALFVIIPVGGMGTIVGILWFFGIPVQGITPYLHFMFALCAVLMWSFFGHLAYQNHKQRQAWHEHMLKCRECSTGGNCGYYS